MTSPAVEPAAAQAARTHAERTLSRAKRWATLLVLLHVGLGLLYDRATPIFEASDEGLHFAFIRSLWQGGGLPVQDPAVEAEWGQEGSQPPLYYLLMATLAGPWPTPDWDTAFVANPFTHHEPGSAHGVNLYRHPLGGERPYSGTALAVHVVRWLSLGLSALTMALVFRLALTALGDPWLAVLAAALAGLNPMVLFINASVNNDNLLMLVSAAAVWVMLVLLARPERHPLRRLTVLGALVGLAALTKLSGLMLWPVAALAVTAGLLRAGGAASLRARLTTAAVRLLLVFGLAGVICGWWYLRNYQLYGDWFGLTTMVAIAGPRTPPLALLDLVRQEWYGFYLSYWGVFGVFSILPALWVHTFYGLLTLWALAGGALALLRRPVRLSPAVALLGLLSVLTLVGVVRWSQQTLASQGRLMFGALGALSTLLAAGVLSGARPLLRLRAGRGWAGGFVLTLSGALALVAAIIPSAFIAPRYVGPTPLTADQLPAEFRPVGVVYGGEIDLLGYTSQADPVQPGQAFTVTLYLRARQPLATDYALALHVLGRGGVAEVSKLDTWPGGGNGATTQWTPGVIYADTYTLQVAESAAWPSVLWLAVDMWADDPAQPLPLTTAEGAPLGEVRFPVGRVTQFEILPPEPPVPFETTFDRGITLVGYEAAPNTLPADGALGVTLYWHLDAAAEPPPVDYTVFVHLVDHQGIPVIEPADAPPVAGDWPTTAWVPGATLLDERLIPLPPNLHAGRYDMRLGLYDPATGERLPAFRPDGTRWPEDMVVIEGLVTR